MRIYCVSDIHVSFPANLDHVRGLFGPESGAAAARYGSDVLIVAGDVCEDISRLRQTLVWLRAAFARVFYCVGNHELWLADEQSRTGGRTSLDKLDSIMRMCEEVGVDTAPQRVGPPGARVWVCPLQSWHEPAFDDEYREHEWGQISMAGDYVYCRWPERLAGGLRTGSVARHFAEMNEPHIDRVLRERSDDDVVVTFSHFLPRLDIINRYWLFNKMLPRVSGCAALDEQLRRLHSTVHVFGHTHIDYDRETDGVRYIQKSFGYPRERKTWKLGAVGYEPVCILEVNPPG